ncbi:MAG: VCBS repeat-containing protein [Flavobacteriales bacterium]|nr:VCBS repeat-containing protein [Flavobacteriales bacterium]
MLSIALAIGCGGDPTPEPVSAPSVATPAPLFITLPAEKSGVHFANLVEENDTRNYFVYEYMYNGGGVAIGDVNGDGLPDIYLTGNLVADRLYLNRGDLRFEDVTEAALPKENTHGWHTGVALADVNGDGHLDIHVCRAGWTSDPQARTNLLYMNDGQGRFKEVGREWGIADTTRSTQGLFFDHDRDGDLDLFVINTPLQGSSKANSAEVERSIKEHRSPTSRLYRNDGNRFTDITATSGLWNMSYSLGVACSDLDQDGIQDLYVSNDYVAPDFLYMGRADGIYTNEILARTRHISNFGMGCDIADYDNDGLPDIVVLDMVSEEHARSKRNMGAMSPARFWGLVAAGYHHQYMFNSLQRNNGNGTFSEVGQLAGISKTDWSWAPLLADLDNDGWKDLLVTNGYKRDMRDNDYNAKAKAIRASQQKVTPMEMLALVPTAKVRNYLFRNNGDLTFTNASSEWGFTEAVNSNGAAYGDLDNDGDLDLVINNMDAPASIHINQAVEQGRGHHLRLLLEGAPGRTVLGSRATVEANGVTQLVELMPVRGFQSSVEPILHFGLGRSGKAEQVEVFWPDGRYTRLTDVPADQVLTIRHDDASDRAPGHPAPVALLEVAGTGHGLNFTHRENPYDDFAVQVLLPHKRSEDGPLMAKADLNGDGREDLYVGGARDQAGALFLSDGADRYRQVQGPWIDHKDREDQGALFLDADGDGDQDLLVLSGGYESDRLEIHFQPRMYMNRGMGRFDHAPGALPVLMTSAQRAAAGDVDGDGSLDLFIGGRVIPGAYPRDPRSYLLLNDGTGRFNDATAERASHLAEAGMLTDALWMDIDGDGDADLITAGEWQPIAMHRNDGGRLVPHTVEGLQRTAGWWNRIVAADPDNDGDQDLICGNIGWNNKFHATADHPLHLYANDMDDNGSLDIVLAKEGTNGKVPVRGRECSSQQCRMIIDRFPTFKDFANADLERIYTPEKIGTAQHLIAEQMRSCVVWNEGGGRFRTVPLPMHAQTAPLNGIAVRDMNGDGHMDIIAAGNHWGAEVETVRYDAGTGIVLLGDGKGGFRPLTVQESGLFAWRNAKDLVVLEQGPGRAPWVVVSNNNDALEVFTPGPARTGLAARR